eukprot:1066421-Rhodomonas_salina.1
MSADYGPDMRAEVEKMREKMKADFQHLQRVQGMLLKERGISSSLEINERHLKNTILQLRDEMQGVEEQNARFRQLLIQH